MKYGLDEIKTFLAVVESGSISGASTRLAITKSVVSQRVTHLEAALGVELLHRSSRGVTPTDRGRVFHEQACAAIAQLEQAAEAVTDDEAALSGLLRISVPMTFGTHYLSPILCEFMRAHPRLELALDLSDRMVDVAAEGYDLAIRITRIKEDSLLVARKLADSRRVVCCSPNYAQERGLPTTLAELPQHVGIGYARLATNHLWQFAPARWRAQLAHRHAQRPDPHQQWRGHARCGRGRSGAGGTAAVYRRRGFARRPSNPCAAARDASTRRHLRCVSAAAAQAAAAQRRSRTSSQCAGRRTALGA